MNSIATRWKENIHKYRLKTSKQEFLNPTAVFSWHAERWPRWSKTRCGWACSIAAPRSSSQRNRDGWNRLQQARVSGSARNNLFSLAEPGLARYSRKFSAHGFSRHGRKFSFSAYPEATRGSQHRRCQRGYFRRISSTECRILKAED